MNFDQIHFHLDQSVTLRLLRTDHAALALGFFFHAFKKAGCIQIPYHELEVGLSRYLDNLEPHLREKFPHAADHYLALWCDEKHRFIRRYYELSNDEPTTELTYDAERALEWMGNLEKKEFVGAQSRFLMVFESLRDLADKADENPTTRIEQLKLRRKHLDREIEQIRTTGKVTRLDDTNVRERFLNIIEDSRRMLTDFRLIEDIFKELTHEVKTKKLQEALSKGVILGEVLDAYDTLEQSHQGKTFDAFWSFLNSPEQQVELKRLSERVLKIQEVQDLVAAHPQRAYDQTLIKLKHQLSQVGQKVLKSRTRLSDELRKLLQSKSIHENHQVIQEIDQIKRLAFQWRSAGLDTAQKSLVDIDYLPRVNLPLERPPWQASTKHDYQHIVVESAQHEAPTATQALDDLMNSFSIDSDVLRARVEAELRTQGAVTLSDLTKKFPVQFGTAELVGYLRLAANDNLRVVQGEDTVSIAFKTKYGAGQAVLPQMTYYRRS